MAQRGRKTKPRAQREAEGGGGHRLLPDEVDMPAPTRAKAAPRSLGQDGRRAWRRLARDLVAAKILSNVDFDALHAYCSAIDQFLKAERYVKKNGMHTYASSGAMVASPYVNMRNQAQEQMRKWANELGITPAARSRVEAITDKGESDEDDFFGYADTSAAS